MTTDQIQEKRRDRHFFLYARLAAIAHAARVTAEYPEGIAPSTDYEISRESYGLATTFLEQYDEIDEAGSL